MGSFVWRSGVNNGLVRSGLFTVVLFLRLYLYLVSRCRALVLSCGNVRMEFVIL